jgi:hypothetical protein
MTIFETARQRLFSAQRAFIGCALCAFIIVGIQSTFTIPPFQVPDESRHWVATITRMRWFATPSKESTGAPVCSVEFGLISKMAQDTLAFQSHNRMPSNTFASLQDTPKDCLPSVVSYGNILTYPGVLVSKLAIHAEERRPYAALAALYASRLIHGFLIAGLLARIFVLSRRLGFVPFGLTFISGLLLSPLFIQQSFGVSADPICFMFALSLITIALFPSIISRADLLIAGFLAVVACHTKPSMALFAPCVALLGFFRYPVRRYLVSLSLIVVASLLGALFVSVSFTSAGSSAAAGGAVISVSEQLAFALKNPVATFSALDSAAWAFFSFEQLAHPLGWLDTQVHKRALSSWYTILWVALGFETLGLLSVPWNSASFKSLTSACCRSSAYLCCLYAASLGTPVILYLSWTAVGAPAVEGMQSRYLFPTLLLLPGAIAPFYRYARTPIDTPPTTHCLVPLLVIFAMAIFTAIYVSELYITVAARYW